MKLTKKPQLHFKDGMYIVTYQYEGQNGSKVEMKKEFKHLFQAAGYIKDLQK
jgi:hypothetical protein